VPASFQTVEEARKLASALVSRLHDLRAKSTLANQKSPPHEFLNRATERRSRHLELLGELDLVGEAIARLEFSGSDRGLDLGCHLVVQRDRAISVEVDCRGCHERPVMQALDGVPGL
jgi:hypothetical protein